MRVKCLQRELSNALMVTSKAVDANSTLPVLNNVLLKAEGKKLNLVSTNLELAIEYSIETDVVNEGEITLPSKLFTQYIGYLKPNDEIEFYTEGETAFINTQDSKTTLKGIASSEFPPIPSVEKNGVIKVNVVDLRRAINQVGFSAAMNTTRPVLGGIYCFIEGSQLKMVSTDSYRLSEKTLSVEAQGEVACIVPARAFLDFGLILDIIKPKEDTVLELTFSRNQVMFSVGNLRLTSRLIEGQFPNYKQILPKAHKTEILFSKENFLSGLKRVNLFAKQNNNKVVLVFENDKVLIHTEGTQFGQGQVEVSCKITGEPNQIALNAQFILDALAGAIPDAVLMELEEKTTPALFRGEKETDYLHIIMPLKL